MYFIITGIQFWVSDYFISVLGVPRETVFITFPIVFISGPVLGVVTGAVVVTRMGGYTNPKVLGLCCLGGFFASVFGIPFAFLNSFAWAVAFLWLLLFCGGMILMPLTGMIINTAPLEIKAVSNSIANIFYNLLGYLPAPFMYGFVQSISGGNASRVGMMVLVMWTIVGNLCILLVLMTRIGSPEQIAEEPISTRGHSFGRSFGYGSVQSPSRF